MLAASLCVALFACAGRGEESLIAGGDCMFGRLPRNGQTADPWEGMAAALRRSDAFLFNLETTIGSGGTPRRKQYVFQSSPGPLDPLRLLSRPIAGMANNHTMDYGAAGLSGTLAALGARGFEHAGAGADEEQAFAPAAAAGGVFQVIAAGVDDDPDSFAARTRPGIASITSGRLLQRVAAARSAAGTAPVAVVVMLHWGIEYDTAYQASEQRLARALVDAGADLVVGSGPHVLRGIESYRGALVCYSLGNLVFDDLTSAETSAGLLLRMSLVVANGSIAARHFSMAPLRTVYPRAGPGVPAHDDAEAIAREIASRSPDPKIFGSLRPFRQDDLFWFNIASDSGRPRQSADMPSAR